MKTIKEIISLKLIYWTLFVLSESDFKKKFAKFIENEIMNF